MERGPTQGALLADLARALPRRPPVDRETIEVYLRELQDIAPSLLAEAVHTLIRTAEWFPTVHAIRECCAEIKLRLPGEAEALAQTDARIRWISSRDGDVPFVHPLVRSAVKQMGGYYAFRTSEDTSILRAQFLKMYRELRRIEITDAVLADDALTLHAGVKALPSPNTPRGDT